MRPDELRGTDRELYEAFRGLGMSEAGALNSIPADGARRGFYESGPAQWSEPVASGYSQPVELAFHEAITARMRRHSVSFEEARQWVGGECRRELGDVTGEAALLSWLRRHGASPAGVSQSREVGR